MLRTPLSGSFVNTSGSVMKRPPSSGQHVRIGISSSEPSLRTTSWHGASFTVFGNRSLRRLTSGASLSASNSPFGWGGVISSSISCARSSSCFTPSARHMRSIDPKTLAATGMSKPVGFSNTSAGPPFGDLHARSVTAAISRSGLTASEIRASSLRLSRSARNSERSVYIVRCLPRRHEAHEDARNTHFLYRTTSCTFVIFVTSWLRRGGYFICNRLRQCERALALFAVDERRTLRAHGVGDVGE